MPKDIGLLTRIRETDAAESLNFNSVFDLLSTGGQHRRYLPWVTIMANWKKAVKQFFANSDPTGEFFHCAEDGVSARTIQSVEKKLKLRFPDELRQFYEHYNGIGLTNDDTEYPNFIPPIEHLLEFVKSARRSFPKSHI